MLYLTVYYVLLGAHDSGANPAATVFTEKPAGAYPSDNLHPGTNEIMDLSDPQQISKQRGGLLFMHSWKHEQLRHYTCAL
jgi:hypothetical protein